ncbi:class I SAM-dependent methyltransferase [Agaribacter marinus]|uniref:Methyltransferase type 11 domain-containing protein n=1 Tax=Agaribacter marinus TaxID=1431249 RepID=A0AA37SYA4_9ALTE|nr:class I SAM-dependent methyltransferase [Agaribacter marinus]GLR71317.1 hypothetical protein GCM10007852_22250 [Agaribacter marinus]
MEQTNQEDIKGWFNNIYKTKGFDYLRPLKAYRIFLRHLNAQSGQRFLDVACGLGLMLKNADENGLKVSGVDLSDEAVKICKQYVPNADVHAANAESLPFDSKQFDMVTCLGSLERMINLEKVLQELHRIGDENAKYCFMVRNSNTFIWQFFKRTLGLQNKYGHQDAKTLKEWRLLFHSAGFNVLKVERDHWPIVRWKRWLSFGVIPVDYEKIPYSPIPIRFATEFVFVLDKRQK